MDTVLNMCYWEHIFQLPNISRAKYVPTHNKIKYCKSLEPILETDRVTREELVELCFTKPTRLKVKPSILMKMMCYTCGAEPAVHENLAKIICRHV